MTRKYSEFLKLTEYYKKNPVMFVKEQFGATPEIYQAEVLNAFVSEQKALKLVMKSSAGVGKSATVAWLGWLFMLCYGDPKNHPSGIATSMTGDNLKDCLWKEMQIWLTKSKLLSSLFEMNAKAAFAKEFKSTWRITARNYDKNCGREESGRVLSGLHGQNLIYLVDESGGILPEVGKAIDQGMGERDAKFVRLVTAGNPMSKDSLLYQESRDPKNFVIGITSDPEDPKRSSRISKEWAQAKIDQYGRNDYWVKVFIFAEFPDIALEGLLSEEDVSKAQAVNPASVRDETREIRMGVDVARFGADNNALSVRQGLEMLALETCRGKRTGELAAWVVKHAQDLGVDRIFIDSTGGYGAGLADALLEGGYAVVEVNFGERAIEDERYFNIRAEMYFKLAEAVKRGAHLLGGTDLRRQLGGILYTHDGKGRLKLEAKDQMKRRLGLSPDEADAVALTHMHGEGVRWSDEDLGKTEDDQMKNFDIYSYDKFYG